MSIKPDRSLDGLGQFLLRLLKDRKGSNSIEFALTAIPLFLFLFGVVEFGRLYWVESDLQFAAEAAARYVTINPSATTSTVQTYAASQVTGISVPTSDFTVTAYSSASNTPACGNQVTVSYQFSFIIGQLFPYGPITLTAEGCHNG